MTDFSKFHLSEEARINTPIPGKESRRLLKLQKEIEGSVVSYPRGIPIAIKKAKGAIVEDVDGNHFIDFFAGAGVLNVGHSNPEVLRYVTRQQRNLVHALDFPTQNKMDAITKILDCLPERLKGQYKVSFGGPTGSDAVESAIKLAKIKTGRETVIAFSGGYHGMTATALALTSDIGFRKKLSSLVPNIHFAPYSYCYRCPLKKEPDSCGIECYDYLKDLIENPHSGIPLPAAIILEPIQGEGGNIPVRIAYLEKLVALARKHGIVTIFDEIQSGFFRSGKFLSFMHTQAVPDIITMSKGIGGIGFPIAGLIYRKDVEAWGPGAHIGTFRGNQASLAAANGAFDFAEKYKLGEYVDKMANYFMKALKPLAAVCPFIGDIRGRGLMMGIEFVKDQYTKEPFPEFVKMFKTNCVQRGLLFETGGHYGNVVRLVPPLIITPKMVDNGVAIMKSVLEEMNYNFSMQSTNGKPVEVS